MDIKTNSSTKTLMTLVTAMILFAPLSSHADKFDTATAKVQYASADASSPAGAALLYSHLKQAADAACGTSDSDMDVIVRHGPSKCVKDAIAAAVRTIKSAQLSQVYIEKNGANLAMRYGIDTTVRTANR